jgi:flagellar hook-basal body complex protein FliE
MLPVNQAAVSLFGASLSPAAGAAPPAPSPASSSSLSGLSLIPRVAAEAVTTAAPFADLLTEAVGEVQHLEVQARDAIKGLISGKGVDVHQAMIAEQKAGMSFELMLSVRNKALAAYQQVLGMQF